MTSKFLRPAIAAALLWSSAALGSAAKLKRETIRQWNQYVKAVDARNREHFALGASFLSSDEIPERTTRLRAGEIVVAPVGTHVPLKVSSGLIHDWAGATFIPNTTTVTLAPAAAARVARPWLQKANAPFTGSLPGAGSQHPSVLTQVLSSSMRTEPGPATLSARLPAGLLVTVQLVTTICHSVGWYAWSLGKAGAMVHHTLSTLFQPSAVKSIRTCQETLSEELPERFQLLAVKFRRLLPVLSVW